MSSRGEAFTPLASGMSDFEEGLQLIRDGYIEEALAHVRHALKVAPQNPLYLSYVGLLLARAEQRFANAAMLCQTALAMRPNDPRLYLNLADVYQAGGRPKEAVEILEKGLLATDNDAGIQCAIKEWGRRRPSVLSFLHRSHPVNRILGKWRHRLTALPARHGTTLRA